MSLLINFKDAVNASVLDPNATVAVFYCDGDTANRSAVEDRCPHARLYAITVRGATGPGIFACDSETGDLTIAQTEAWVAEQIRLNVKPIVVYANQDRWLNLGLLTALAKYGDRLERWDADYDGSAVVPSWASAKQYATGSVDLNVAVANFFSGATPVPPKPKPKPAHGTCRFEGSYDLKTGHWTIHGIPGLDVHFAKSGGYASAELQVDTASGKWRIRSLPLNAKPLGG